jgi:hypothetical protein
LKDGEKLSDTPEPNDATAIATPIVELERGISRHELAMRHWAKVVGVFTVVLAAVGALQTFSFIESERAFLILSDISFLTGEPSNGSKGLDVALAIKNVGKHTATVSKIVVNPGIFMINKELAEDPIYDPTKSTIGTAPPIAPEVPLVLFAESHTPTPPAPMTEEQRIQGILSGDTLVRVWGLVEYDTGYFH